MSITKRNTRISVFVSAVTILSVYVFFVRAASTEAPVFSIASGGYETGQRDIAGIGGGGVEELIS